MDTFGARSQPWSPRAMEARVTELEQQLEAERAARVRAREHPAALNASFIEPILVQIQ